MPTHAMLATALALALTSCAGEPKPAPPAPVTAARVSAADFGRLRWLEGRWRGELGNGTPFFEAYYFQDDSTIRSYGYEADTTMAAPRDSGFIRLRGDSLTSGAATPGWVATALDSLSVTFVDLGGAPRGFTWRSTGPGAWTATLTWDSAGTPRERVYEMRTVP